MNLFSKNTPKTIDKTSVVERTNNALGLFTQAVTALTGANEEASSIVQQNEERIASLTEDNSELTTVVEKNQKVIDNINKLLS